MNPLLYKKPLNPKTPFRVKILLRFILYPILFLLLVQVLTGSFFLSCFWLPLIASFGDYDLLVGEANYSFWNRSRLTISGVQLSDRKNFLLKIDHAQGELSFYQLLCGVFSCDSIEMNHAELRLRNPVPSPQSPSKPAESTERGKNTQESFPADKFRIGSVEIQHFTVIHENESGSKELSHLHLKNVNLTGMRPDVSQILKLDAEVSSEYPHLHIENTAVHLEAKFILNHSFLPKDLLLSSMIQSNKAKSSPASEFSDLSGSCTFQVNQDSRIPQKYNISGNLELNQFDCVEFLEMHLDHGEIFLPDLHGNFILTTNCSISDYRLEQFYLPKRAFSTGINYFPEKMNFQTRTQISFSESGLAMRGQVDASAEKFWYNNAILMENPHFQLRHNWSHDQNKQQLNIRQLEMSFNGSDFQCELHNSGSFIYDFQEGEVTTINAAIRGNAKNLPLVLFNPAIPIDLGSGLCDLELLIEKQQTDSAAGKLDLLIRDFTVNAAGEPLIKPQKLSVLADLHSTGGNDLRFLKIERCHVELGDDQELAAQADLNGSFRFLDQELKLDGTLLFRTIQCLERITTPIAKKIVAKMRDAHSEKMTNLFQLTTLFQPQKNLFTFQSESRAQSFSLLGEPQYQDQNLTLSLNGSFSYSALGSTRQSGLSMHAALFSQDLLDISADATFRFPEHRSVLNLNLKQLNPAFVRSIFRWKEPDTPCQKNLTEKFSFQSLTANAGIQSDFIKKSFRILPLEVKVKAQDRGVVRLTLNTPVVGSFLDERPQLTNTKLILSLEDLPITYCNHFIPDYSDFFFADGLVQGSCAMVLKDSFRTIDMQNDMLIEDLKFKLCDSILDFRDFRINGATAFTGIFTDMEFLGLTGHSFDGDSPFLKLTANGSIGLQDDNITALDFEVAETAPQLLRTVFGDTMDSFDVRKFHADGKVRYLADAAFDHNNIQSSLAVHDLSVSVPFPDEEKVVPLTGTFSLNFDSVPDLLRFDHTRLTLRDGKNRMIFDLGLHGDLHMPGKPQTVCRLDSDGMDLEFLKRACRKQQSQQAVSTQQKEAEDDEKDQEDTNTGNDENAKPVWPFLTEPAVMQLGGYQAGFDVSFNNITFTEFVRMGLTGYFQAQNNALIAKQLQLKINEAPAVLNGSIALNDPAGYRYDLHLTLQNLQASAIVRAAAKIQNEKNTDSDIKLKIDSLDIKTSGTGISLANIEKNFKGSFQATLSDISLPPAVKDLSLILQILLLPVTSLPRAIEQIPQQNVRDALMKIFMGDHVELLTGGKNLEFAKGELQMENYHSDFLIRKLYLYGPVIKTKVVKGWINPFYNELEVETMTRLSGVTYPMHLKGRIGSTKVVIPDFLLQFWAKNAEHLLQDTADAVTLGMVDENAAWRKPAQEMKREKWNHPKDTAASEAPADSNPVPAEPPKQ